MLEADMYYASPATNDPHLHSNRPVEEQIKPDYHRMTIEDARSVADKLSLDREGFVLCEHRAVTPFEPGFVEFNLDRKRDTPELNKRYADELIPLIRELSGGDEIVPQAGRMTVRATARTGLVTSDPTAPIVHLDYTERAVADAIDLTMRLEGREVPPHSRVALYQTWRPLTDPPHDSILAICDAKTVSTDNAIVLQTHTPGLDEEVEHIEVSLCTYEPEHRWYYVSDMRTDEILVFKGYDSAFPESAGGAHVAIDNMLAEHPNGRVSVEARFLVFYR